MENTKQIDHRIADWSSVLELVGRLRFFRANNFDLHISKRQGQDFQINLEDHSDQVTRATPNPPVKFTVGLHDLYW